MDNNDLDSIQTYPIIKFPYEIQPYFQGLIPELQEIYSPKKQEITIDCLLENVGFLKPSFIILGIYFGVEAFQNYTLISLVIFLGVIGLSFVLIGIFQTFIKEREQTLTYFNKSMEDYNKKVREQFYLKSELMTEEQKTDFIKRRIKEIAAKYTRSAPIAFNSAQKGKSEDLFKFHLRSIFGKNITIDQSISEMFWTYCYVPDLIYSDGQLSIDIEIDEPYTLYGLEPIHFYDETKKEHIDVKRDDYFLKRNWFVLRFSELQVYESPLSCCRIIANLIKVVTENDEFIKKLEDVPKLNKHNVWTYGEAKLKSQQSFRSSYSY